MNLTRIHPAVIITALILSLLALIVFGIRRELKRRRHALADRARQAEAERLERLRNMPLPEGTTAIRWDEQTLVLRPALVGGYMFVGIGGFGLNLLRRLLVLLDHCGLEQIVGGLLVIESDAQELASFLARIPAVFLDRIVYGSSPTFGGGMSNGPVGEVMGSIALWGVPVAEAVEKAADLHLRRNASRSPSDIFLFASMGGQAPEGLEVVDLLKKHFAESMLVAFTALPRMARLRENFAALKAHYESLGVFGWVLGDNLGEDPGTNDYGMLAIIVGLADASLYADQPTKSNNAFRQAFTREPGGILIYQVVDTPVVGFPFVPALRVPPRYYVYTQSVVEHVIKGLDRLAQGMGVWSADLPIGEPDTATFDLVLASLTPESLQAVEDKVVAGLKLRERYQPMVDQLQQVGSQRNGHSPVSLFGKANYELPFAGVATVIDPEKPVCPVVLVRLAAVRNGAALLSDIVKVPARRAVPLAQLSAPSGAMDKENDHV